MAKQKTYSGKFVVRVDSGLHESLVEIAAKRNESLNKLIKKILERNLGNYSPKLKKDLVD